MFLSDPERSSGVEACLSDDAGRYLCDFVFYQSLRCGDGKAIFIHVPRLNEPYSADQLAKAIVFVIEEVVKLIV